jgi:hypothetical protein
VFGQLYKSLKEDKVPQHYPKSLFIV